MKLAQVLSVALEICKSLGRPFNIFNHAKDEVTFIAQNVSAAIVAGAIFSTTRMIVINSKTPGPLITVCSTYGATPFLLGQLFIKPFLSNAIFFKMSAGVNRRYLFFGQFAPIFHILLDRISRMIYLPLISYRFSAWLAVIVKAVFRTSVFTKRDYRENPLALFTKFFQNPRCHRMFCSRKFLTIFTFHSVHADFANRMNLVSPRFFGVKTSERFFESAFIAELFFRYRLILWGHARSPVAGRIRPVLQHLTPLLYSAWKEYGC